MMKLGFIDYYLDEWHANNYLPWIKKHSGGRLDVAMAYGDTNTEGRLTNEQWCGKNCVEQAGSIDELVERCDGIIVLSPDNPEHHVRLSEKALKSGKPVYIDKTFSPCLKDAKAMFSLANQHSTPMYSTSALRYAQELSELDASVFNRNSITALATRGQGKFDNYSVHQLEIIVKMMGTDVQTVTFVGSKDSPCLVYGFGGGRTAFIHLIGNSLSVAVNTNSCAAISFTVRKDFWTGFICDLVQFFETGKPPVESGETLAVIAMYEEGRKALTSPFATQKI